MADTPNGRRNLWRAVIRQAMEDAARYGYGNNFYAGAARVERARARAWLTGQSADFNEVCALADLEPDQVHKDALALIAMVDARVAAGLPAKPSKASLKAKAEPQRYEFQGERLTLPEWSKRTGISHTALRARLNAGWPLARALTEPVVMGSCGKPHSHREARRITFEGKTMTVREWAEATGISYQTLHARLEAHWPVSRALTTPKVSRQHQPEPVPA